MKLLAPLALLVGGIPGLHAADQAVQTSGTMATALAPLPDDYGFAGMFAGVSGNTLLCAGGANFPEKPLAQGGKKKWHDRVFALTSPAGAWREVGRLPWVNGYGVSATWRDAVILAGGGDATTNFREVLLARWDGTRLSFEKLPSLPVATANGCGAIVGDTLYVAGGQETPTTTSSLRRCFAMNLAQSVRAWLEIPWPTAAPGRILAVAAAHDGWFYLFSGADLFPNAAGQAERRYLKDAWRFQPEAGWQRLADLPHAVAAAPSPAITTNDARLLIAGGVSPEFLAGLPKDSPHPGFPSGFLAYDIVANNWATDPASSASPLAPARVTAPLARWKNLFVVPSGEVAPGIRTPTVLAFSLKP